MQPTHFVDHYETLQVSHNADPDTIHRIYRILAQRFHPDNQETGSVDIFRMLTESYQVLADPEKRAAYDVRHREARCLTWKIFDQSTSALGVEAERRKREGVLSLLYRKRISEPDKPSMNLKELEEMLGVPKEHLEFTLWFLRENQQAKRSDNARFEITLKGVEEAEAILERKTVPMLTSASRVA
jgi:curved DNA-binding protein CbpA